MAAKRDSITFKVEGMSCEHCRRNIEKAVSALEGVTSVTVDLDKKEVAVTFDTGSVQKEELAGAITLAGYQVTG